MVDDAGVSYVQRLGAELRARRLARGMSLRALAKELGLSGHGTLVDYEYGRRIPPEDLLVGWERIFEVSDGALRNLREKALTERAGERAELLLREPPAPPRPVAGPEPERRERRHRRRWLVLGAAAVIVAAGAGVGVSQWQKPPESGPQVRFSFEDGTNQRWSPLWGAQYIDYNVTDVTAHDGAYSLELKPKGPSNGRANSIGTTHGLESLHAGMKVTFYLRVPYPEAASVLFFAYDSRYRPHNAPETPRDGGELPLPAGTGWQAYTWTVPPVDTVFAIGMQTYVDKAEQVTVYLDAVTW